MLRHRRKAFLSIALLSLMMLQGTAVADQNDPMQAIETYVVNQMDQYNIPGLAIGIIKNNEIVYAKGFGTADSSGREVSAQTPFIIGSVSKSFTALAIMQLVEKETIHLDDSVDIYLPWFRASYQGIAQHITVRQLLQHTSGMKPFYDGMVDEDTSIEQLSIDLLNNTELNATPGQRSEYSNANYILLGAIVEQVSGLTFGEYISANIFQPLQMEHSFVSKEQAKEHGLATGHQKWFGFPIEADLPYFACSLPEGQIISCVEDMLHYVSALLNKGVYQGQKILSADGVDELFNTDVREDYVPAGIDGTESYYAFGWRVIYSGTTLNMIQHTGETGNYHANVILNPAKGIGVVELDSLGGDMSPVSIGVGAMQLMNGETPEYSRFINNVFLAERIVVACILILLTLSCIRLRRWKERIGSSKRRYRSLVSMAVVINLILPLAIILFFPGLFDSTWKSSMLVFPDISCTALLIASVLLLIGLIKLLLTIQYHVRSSHLNQSDCLKQ